MYYTFAQFTHPHTLTIHTHNTDILVSHDPSSPERDAVDRDTQPSLEDVPDDALSSTSLSQFHTRMRPYLWMQYPSATTAEISSIINHKWKAIQALRKDSEENGEKPRKDFGFSPSFSGKQRRRSEVNMLGGVAGAEFEEEEEPGGGRRPQRRAAKNLAKNVYSMGAEEEMEFVDSPASTGTSSAKDTPPIELPTGTSSRRQGVGGVKRGRGGKMKGRKRGSGMKVPPMKIKLIGRSGASDSPIFFAESLGEVCTHTLTHHTHTHTHTNHTHTFTLTLTYTLTAVGGEFRE